VSEEVVMFVSIRTYRVGTGSIEAVMHRVDRELADAFAREPGFVSYWVAHTGEHTVAAITTFQDREQAEASNELAAQWVAEELGDFEVERMGVMNGPVMVSRANEAVLAPARR
jgi:quinol monooxygenase YgiN